MIGITIGAIAIVALINAVWLGLWSDIFSRILFREELPLLRAAKSTGAAFAFSWIIGGVISLVIGASFDLSSLAMSAAPSVLAAIMVFLWEWRSFHRHWRPDDDVEVAQVFE